MKKVFMLPLCLSLAFASCSRSPEKVPSYEVDGFTLDDAAGKAEYVVVTPQAYSRDSILKVAAAIHHSAVSIGAYNIRFYNRERSSGNYYGNVYYEDDCRQCDFNAKDMYGVNLRVETLPVGQGG